MPEGSTDPNWPRLLSLAVHEFRTPMTVVAGYIRMLLKDRAGPLGEQQRRLLEEAEKSCVRLSALLAEMSELSNLEARTASFNRGTVDLRALIADVVAALTPVPDRDIAIAVSTGPGTAIVHGDSVRLKSAFTAILNALRRELVTSTTLHVHESSRADGNGSISWIAFGDADHIAGLERAAPSGLTPFDEWRGGCGLSLAIARRTISAHGGAIWSPDENLKAGAVVFLPLA